MIMHTFPRKCTTGPNLNLRLIPIGLSDLGWSLFGKCKHNALLQSWRHIHVHGTECIKWNHFAANE